MESDPPFSLEAMKAYVETQKPKIVTNLEFIAKDEGAKEMVMAIFKMVSEDLGNKEARQDMFNSLLHTVSEVKYGNINGVDGKPIELDPALVTFYAGVFKRITKTMQKIDHGDLEALRQKPKELCPSTILPTLLRDGCTPEEVEDSVVRSIQSICLSVCEKSDSPNANGPKRHKSGSSSSSS